MSEKGSPPNNIPISVRGRKSTAYVESMTIYLNSTMGQKAAGFTE